MRAASGVRAPARLGAHMTAEGDRARRVDAPAPSTPDRSSTERPHSTRVGPFCCVPLPKLYRPPRARGSVRPAGPSCHREQPRATVGASQPSGHPTAPLAARRLGSIVAMRPTSRTCPTLSRFGSRPGGVRFGPGFVPVCAGLPIGEKPASRKEKSASREHKKVSKS